MIEMNSKRQTKEEVLKHIEAMKIMLEASKANSFDIKFNIWGYSMSTEKKNN